MIARGACLAFGLLAAATCVRAQPEPSFTQFVPAGGKGTIVLVVSGISGPPKYEAFARAVADAGYYTLLLDGRQMWTGGQEAIRGIVARAQGSPHALPGKAAVIGLSVGGAVVLRHAGQVPDAVYAAVAYYPATDRIADGDITPIRVPTLVLAGVRDRFSCCTIDRARALAAVARESAAKPPIELVEYPEADHAFNLAGALRPDEAAAADAMRRTLAHLRRHAPAP